MLWVPIEALTRVYGGLDLGANGLVGIVRLDNTLMLRWPDTGGSGRRVGPASLRVKVKFAETKFSRRVVRAIGAREWRALMADLRAVRRALSTSVKP